MAPYATGRRVLDLGCGPGSLTRLLAPYAAEVVAVDAEADMVRVGAALGLPRVTWVQARAEELEPEGTFGLVTMAQSFHWMDQPLVARRIHSWLEPDGVAVFVGAWSIGTGATGFAHPPVPHDRVNALARAHLADRPAPVDHRHDHNAPFVAAGFVGPQLVPVPGGDVLERTEDQVVAYVLSLSYAAPHLFGDRLDAFVADLRALLREVSPAGLFSEQWRDLELRVWRQGAASSS